MPTACTSLADFLDQLAGTLKDAAVAARAIADPTLDLPPTLTTGDVAALENWSRSTVWRKAKLGELDGLISAPDEPLRFDRDTYLEHRRRRRELALARAEGGGGG
jgi:hypothetical protein